MSLPLTAHDYIRLCYRGVSAYADGMPLDLLRAVHITTGLDKAIIHAVKAGKSVVLTGNPGDGKTHLLRVLEDEIKKANRGAVVQYDASEVANTKLIQKWKTATRNKVPFCVAVNEAVLKQLADDSFAPALEAQRQVEQAIEYCRNGDAPTAASLSDLVVYDLGRRNVLAADIVRAVVNTFITVERPRGCMQSASDFSVHALLLGVDLFLDRLNTLFERVARRGFHCTLRELQGFISYLLCRGLDCEALSASSGNADNFLSELVFAGEGPLFDQLRNGFDPRLTSHPVWDVRLVSADVTPDKWKGDTTEVLHSCDVEDVNEVARRRRRFYFFHDDGEALLTIADDADGQFDQFLNMRERDVLRLLIPRINAAFRDSSPDDLRIWKCHRFDHSDERCLTSGWAVSRRSLEVVQPRLRAPMSSAYDYLPDHIVLRLKDDNSARLVIDFQMFAFLRNTEYGLSILSVNNHLTRRLWRFMERLAVSAGQMDGEVDIRIMDFESGHALQVMVDLDDSQYVSIQGAS
jgi:hypothetical protein